MWTLLAVNVPAVIIVVALLVQNERDLAHDDD